MDEGLIVTFGALSH